MRLLRLTPLIALPACLVGTAIASAAQTSTPAATVATVPRVAFRDLGRAPIVPVRLAVALHYQHENEMAPLAMQLSGLPGRRVLTAQQFLNYFSPSAADYQRTAATFAQMGFRIVKTYGNRTALEVEAPAAVVDRAFDTDIHAVLQPGVAPANGRSGIPAGLRYANVRTALLPASLRSSVSGILGFNNLITKRPTYVLTGGGVSPGVALGPPLHGPQGGFGPLAFAGGYDLMVQHQVVGGKNGQTYDGTGQATANVIDSDFNDSDLAAFLSYFNVTRTGPATKRILVDGGAHNRNDELETDLDVDTIVGTSPGTALDLYLMPDLSDQSIFDAYAQIDSDDVVDAANSSFGGCEQDDPPFATMTDKLALAGVLLGINYSASTGDDGSANHCNSGLGVSAPASGPHFLAVGGTTLYVNSDGSYNNETCWTGSGGGVSQLFSLPAYQAGIPGVMGNTRNVPDIGFDANPSTGEAEYIDGRFEQVGGTSLSSPIMTSLVTQFDEYNGARYGDLHPLIWSRFRNHAYDAFEGLPIFNQIKPGGSNGKYSCTTGYDLVTGIGSINGWGGSQAYRDST